MNPPAREEGSGAGGGNLYKKGKTNTKTSIQRRIKDLGTSTRELAAQFIIRSKELCERSPVCAFTNEKMFVNESFGSFRNIIKAVNHCFAFPCSVFSDVKGQWAMIFSIIGFDNKLVENNTKCKILDKNGNLIGTKDIKKINNYMPNCIKRPVNSVQCVPLSSALEIVHDAKIRKMAYDAIGFAAMDSNSVLSTNLWYLISSSSGTGSSITSYNFEKIMIMMAVMKSVIPSWINASDQFEFPDCEFSEEFIIDCVIFNLFSGHNNTSSFTSDYQNSKWYIDNQFYPFNSQLAIDNGPKDESFQLMANKINSTFVSSFLSSKTFSSESTNVYQSGYNIYKLFYENYYNINRIKWKIENCIPGWYQIKNSLVESQLGINELNIMTKQVNCLQKKLLQKIYDYKFLAKEEMLEIQGDYK
jgi:hypothetical protein